MTICRQCNRRGGVLHHCSRKGGGNYRRAHRIYRSTICVRCVYELLDHATPGTLTVQRWSIIGLRSIAKKEPRP